MHASLASRSLPDPSLCRCPAADGVVFCAASADARGAADWLTAAGAPLPVYPQVQDPDLGRRMIAALTAAVTAGGTQLQGAVTPATAPGQGPAVLAYEAAIVIGTDIPDLSSEVLSAAVEALLGPSPQGEHSPALGTATEPVADVVLGPSADGGYYLLGFRTEALLLPDVQSGKVFEGVEWSCSTVLQKTVEAVEDVGLRVASTSRLPILRDIDTKEDAAEWLLRCRLDVDAVQGPSLQGQMVQLVREWL